MKHIYKHLGYYNEVGDIRELSRKSADDIVDYYEEGYGAFYADEYGEGETDLIYEEEEDNIAKGDVKRTSDGLYVISDTTWEGWVDDYADKEDGDDSDAFIDIYRIYKIEEFGIEFEER